MARFGKYCLYIQYLDDPMPSLSILARGERLRERLLADVADLRITGFQSPAEDEKEEGLSLDRLTGLGAPHIWGVRVLDDTLLGFGIFPGDRLIVNRAASHFDSKLVVVDLGDGYRVIGTGRLNFAARMNARSWVLSPISARATMPVETSRASI